MQLEFPIDIRPESYYNDHVFAHALRQAMELERAGFSRLPPTSHCSWRGGVGFGSPTSTEIEQDLSTESF